MISNTESMSSLHISRHMTAKKPLLFHVLLAQEMLSMCSVSVTGKQEWERHGPQEAGDGTEKGAPAGGGAWARGRAVCTRAVLLKRRRQAVLMRPSCYVPWRGWTMHWCSTPPAWQDSPEHQGGWLSRNNIEQPAPDDHIYLMPQCAELQTWWVTN